MAESDVQMTGVRVDSWRRVSWGAVFAGVVITLVVQALLTLLGVGIGAATVDPLRESEPGRGLGVGAGIWLLVSTLIAVYVGSMVAGRMSGTIRRSDRILHGLLTWGTAAIIGMLALTTSGGALLGGAGALMGGAGAMLRNGPAYASSPGMGAGTVPGRLSPTGRETGTVMNEPEARATADQAARRVSQGALWGFMILVLSGVVSGLGASPRRNEWRGKGEAATVR